MRTLHTTLCAAMAATALTAHAQTVGDTVTYIACPTYRDTDAGRKSGCWLAEDNATGVRYDVTLSPTKPDWNYAVLVEGVVTDGSTAPCGGVVLEPARVSVLDQTCAPHMIPAEGHAGRPYSLPPRNVRPLAIPRETPPLPHDEKSFNIMFDFNKDFITYQLSDYYLDEAITWIRGTSPSRIIVTGYAATQPTTVSGQRLKESRAIAKARAQRVTEALRLLGTDEDIIDTRWRSRSQVSGAEGADGLPEASRRRVEIRVIP